MTRPVTARHTMICLACGGQIIKGVHRVMKRYAYDDWVHSRPSCLYSNVIRDVPSQLSLPEL